MIRTVDTGTDDLLAVVEDGVGVLTLNRPARRNALTLAMLDGLAAVLAQWEADPAVASIVLTGAGGAFCAGGDVQDFAARGGDTPQGAEALEEWHRSRLENELATSGLLRRMDTPSIAALPGAVAGAGLGLALACDLRVGCPSTVVTTAFVKIGLSGDYGVPWLLHRLVGPSRAARLMLFSERLDAEQAAALGLLDWTVADERVDAYAVELAATLAEGPRPAIAAIKANLRDAEAVELAEAMEIEIRRYRRCADSPDHAELVQRFVNGRRAAARR